MSRLLILFKTALNLNFGISALKYRYTREGKSKFEPLLIGLGILAGAAPLLFLYSLFMTAMFGVGKSLNQPELILTTAFVVTQAIILFFGIFYVMGAFYFSNDLNILIPMPLKPYEVLGSKFLIVMVNEYLTALPVLLPPLIIYGAGTGQNLLYWLKGLILMLAAPAIPLVTGALFIMILMRVVNFRRSKDLLAVIGGFLGIFVALGFNMLFSRMPKGNEQEYINNLLAANAGLVNEIGKKFPPSIWATFGLSKPGLEGLLYFLLFIGVSAFLFLVFLWLGNRIFYKSFLSGQEVSKRRKAISSKEMDKRYEKVSNPVSAIYIREWKLLLRTPVYVLNGLTGSIIGPFIILLMLATQGSNSEKGQLIAEIQKPGNALIVALVGLAVMLFTAGVNVVTATSVSREGQTFWIAKMIPVPPRQQVLGKFFNGFAVSALGVLVTGIILAVFIGIPVYRVLVITVIALLGAVFMNSINMIIDVVHPRLVWKSPTEAMKQNINGLLAILVAVIYGGLLSIPVVIMVMAGASEPLIYLALVVLTAGPSVPGILGMLSLADRQYAKLEA